MLKKSPGLKKIISLLSMFLIISAMSQGTAGAMGKIGKTGSDEKQAPVIQKDKQSDVLPKLVDLGAKKCVPCKMMAPILEALKIEYRGKMEVVFIDVWQQPDEGKKYGIRMIPTQIFYAPDGEELFRHQGFFSKEDIIATWKKYGYEFEE